VEKCPESGAKIRQETHKLSTFEKKIFPYLA
jgi:hypothetical protein